MGNLRFGSALQILKDLSLIEDDEDGMSSLTADGRQFYRREMTREEQDEVS
jgi:hypothetical protein